ncbi:hypothetical protein GCM10010112_42660 [Actinoplanes lobatus]|uniref:PPM-type phosphatase domain-containing protein n=1 Tax=Actinoplanes lobatus TaxID=113568 RepID=A0A7W7MF90_9ACTN|nr:PP2C family serine/threonine-protein phosphatase [Actinoplanes lobatus]MBB4747690.1 hypothetical protein [Actinoplanes lobatus]GGN73401.1 hypothetical protein GCM10010112_42660 [Actinoplanes lobatus]GIE39745.1 hypothetical protein Alo02nite_26430 [Actinoplanes lobatus]
MESHTDTPGWALAGGLATGTAHLANDLPCQDRIRWAGGDGWLVAALADGAGSAAASDLGAETAVRTAVEVAERLCHSARPVPPERLLPTIFRATRYRMRAVAAGNRLEPRDLACTLALVVVHGDLMQAAQIGDGVAVVRDADKELSIAAPPMRGEFANEATFLTTGSTIARPPVRTMPVADVDAFALSSDGLRLLITERGATGDPYQPFFDDVFQAVRDGAGDADLTAFLERADDKTGDDKSLIIGVRQ